MNPQVTWLRIRPLKPAVWVAISMVLIALVSAGCRPEGGEWKPYAGKHHAGPDKGSVVASILGANELELRALEAVEAFAESGDDSDLDEAIELLNQSRELLREASEGWARLLAEREITFDEWRAGFKELQCARLNDTRAEEQMESESFVIEDVMDRIEVALDCKEKAVGLNQ